MKIPIVPIEPIDGVGYLDGENNTNRDLLELLQDTRINIVLIMGGYGNLDRHIDAVSWRKKNMNQPPTEKQLKYITKLQRELGMPAADLEELKKEYEINAPHRFSSIGASNLINDLKGRVSLKRKQLGR